MKRKKSSDESPTPTFMGVFFPLRPDGDYKKKCVTSFDGILYTSTEHKFQGLKWPSDTDQSRGRGIIPPDWAHAVRGTGWHTVSVPGPGGFKI